jgi:predicted MFS family arabinose efflux permease
LQTAARPLFVAAFLFGIFSAVYWTYAVELLWKLSGTARDSIIFWIVLGMAGVTGCFAGGLVNRWGLRQTYWVLALVVGAAVATLPFLIGIRHGIYFSAAFFGSGFIVMTALFGMWSMRIFREAPSIGFGLTFFLISLGQGVGPVIGGFAIPLLGHSMLFVLSGLMCCGLALFRPVEREVATAHA